MFARPCVAVRKQIGLKGEPPAAVPRPTTLTPLLGLAEPSSWGLFKILHISLFSEIQAGRAQNTTSEVKEPAKQTNAFFFLSVEPTAKVLILFIFSYGAISSHAFCTPHNTTHMVGNGEFALYLFS